jgi:hypothetical protein
MVSLETLICILKILNYALQLEKEKIIAYEVMETWIMDGDMATWGQLAVSLTVTVPHGVQSVDCNAHPSGGITHHTIKNSTNLAQILSWGTMARVCRYVYYY